VEVPVLVAIFVAVVVLAVLMAVLAVVVAASARSAQVIALRAQHAAIMAREAADPALAAVWGGQDLDGLDEAARAQHLHVNEVVSMLETQYELRQVPEAHVRQAAAMLLASGPGRQYWGRARAVRLSSSRTRRGKRFHLLLDEVAAYSPAA
jgi:hypothetical protein